MIFKEKYSGFAIAIAWPETYCKQPGSWYDPLAFFLGLNKNHYYKVGHAALVLVNSIEKKCYYYDFGRYHTPFQHGRVRGANTDHDLEMKTIPKISNDNKEILNFKEILLELQNNPACHGEGEIHASYTNINFKKALSKVSEMQNAKSIAYGPFRINGSNCSRFVNTAILAGEPSLIFKLRLKYLIPFSPTPKGNVKALNYYSIVKKQLNNIPFNPIKPLSNNLLKVTLVKPQLSANIPSDAQWLSGEGAGSWYTFNYVDDKLKVTRFSPEGKTECLGFFKSENNSEIPSLNKLEITYPSNCAEVSLMTKNNIYRFIRT